jgi:ZIP family zinc transporter
MQQNVLLAFSLTLLAGLATGIGGGLAFVAKRTNKRLLCISLGFSAGVMIYVSFVEILGKAKDCLISIHGEVPGTWFSVLAFFGGILAMVVIDFLVPTEENPHHLRSVEEMDNGGLAERKLYRMGLFSALAIVIHNFPEGMATFTSALDDPKLGISIAVAIGIHNIPEGISVAIPVYYATGSRKKAFILSFLSGLSEPLGALIGFMLLKSFFTPTLFGILFSAVGGVMVYVSLDELFPAAREHGSGHLSIGGLIAGKGVMALSLLLFM